MHDTPAISVIVPVYNMAAYLGQALDSVLAQTLENIEVICVDDCSTDGSAKILADYAVRDARIKIITMDKNSGAGPARNAGINHATGEFIAFLDPDDLLPDDNVYIDLYKAAQKNKAKIAGGHLLEFNGTNIDAKTLCSKAVFKEERFYHYSEYPYSVGFYRFIYDRKFVIENELLFPPLRRFQDPVWFVNILMKENCFYGIPRPAYLYRKNHQKIIITPEKAEDIFKGISINLKMFDKADFKVHYMREQKELNYYFYKLLYHSISSPFARLPKAIKLIFVSVRKYEHINLRLYHVYGFLRYGLTFMKLRMLYYKNRSK
jgi:glycosyltransferase involved in cell wall biosynthesis